jgi:queuine tRNA-ribosyltransferase
MSNHQIEQFSNGSFSVRNLELNECMHSSIGPWTEAQQIYLGQSSLVERLTLLAEKPFSQRFVIYDLGLGIAANSISVFEALNAISPSASWNSLPQVSLISFETDLEGIKNALVRPELFPFLSRNAAVLKTLIETRQWSGKLASGISLRWDLKIGDFRDQITQCPTADLVFFDLYSPKSCPELWGVQTFRALSQKSHFPQNPDDRETLLMTYSASTAARAALMLSGFFVGKGIATQGKRETTLANTRFSSLSSPLSKDWLEHWQRSSRPLPADYSGPLTEKDRKLIVSKVLRAL